MPCTSFMYFILTSYSLYTQVMLILVLNLVHYLQIVVFSFENGLNGQNTLPLRFPPLNKKVPPPSTKFPIPHTP